MQACPDGVPLSAVPLLALPFSFSQVRLLDPNTFRREARARGFRVTNRDLESLADLGLLVPFFRFSEEPGAVLATATEDETHEARMAREGYLSEGSTSISVRRSGEGRYCQWQLLGLRTALSSRRAMAAALPAADELRELAVRERGVHIALAALSNRYFPQIIGKSVEPRGSSFHDLRLSARRLDAAARLRSVGASSERLVQDAEWLLTAAHYGDPLGGWWEIVRRSNHYGWFKLKGEALHAVWQRIGAEVLLRAHEELSARGRVAPLPERSPHLWHPLDDRIGLGDRRQGLDEALTRMRVSPHPPVVLVLEGQVEELHVGALLKEIGVSEHVRVVNQRTSSDDPSKLATFLAPRIREARADRQILERNPVALFVAMDPEGSWGQVTLQRTIDRLRSSIRREVESQNGSIAEGELDALLNVRTWGNQKYELANFSNDELAEAMLAIAPREPIVTRADLIEHLAYARSRGLDIGVVFERARWPILKMPLANQLERLIVTKLDITEAPPVIELAWAVRDAVEQLSRGTIYLAPSEKEGPAAT